jgi:hypothetical protein
VEHTKLNQELFGCHNPPSLKCGGLARRVNKSDTEFPRLWKFLVMILAGLGRRHGLSEWNEFTLCIHSV